jgi:hypothetical protein
MLVLGPAAAAAFSCAPTLAIIFLSNNSLFSTRTAPANAKWPHTLLLHDAKSAAVIPGQGCVVQGGRGHAIPKLMKGGKRDGGVQGAHKLTDTTTMHSTLLCWFPKATL